LCGIQPQFQDAEHLFFALSSLAEQLSSWFQGQSHWRQNVLGMTNRYLKEGLKDRAITRDLDWGIRVPLPGFKEKRIYVWFEAVIGYLSATKEWAQACGEPERWRDFWQKDAKAYYFIGKDNIFFHTIIWPAMLMGYGGLNLPYDVPANEFLTLNGKKFSTSRNWAVWLPDFLSRYNPDSLRYFLSANMPETADADFSWAEFVRRNNDELVATYGNLAHRTLSFAYRNFAGCVPVPGELDAEDNQLLVKAKETLETMAQLLYLCHFREALRAALSLAQESNRYLDYKAPWKMVKSQKEASATSVYVALGAISCLKTVLYPFLPFSSQKLHHLLGFEGKLEDDGWRLRIPEAGQRLQPPEHLFAKLDDEVVAEETERLEKAVAR
jgi:methionyl-tRNA synthetase